MLKLDGGAVTLRELWRERPSVTSFVRHFGCLFCHQMVDDLVQTVPTIVARGANVIIVGNGSVNQARHFFTDKGLPANGVTVVTDPERGTYRAAGFERGAMRTFNPISVASYARARLGGHRVSGLFGDLTQLGGVLVVRPPAQLLYIQRSKFAGDHPKMDEVIAAIPPAR